MSKHIEVEYESEEEKPKVSTKRKRAKTKSALKKRQANETIGVTSAPEKWEEVWDLISDMRYSENGIAAGAAVDTMGAATQGKRGDKEGRFHVLIGVMLSR